MSKAYKRIVKEAARKNCLWCKKRFDWTDSNPYGPYCGMKCFYAAGVEVDGVPYEIRERMELQKLKKEMGVDD